MIIALIGPVAAKYLEQKHGFSHHPFAGPLKKMLMVGVGLSYEQVYGNLKEGPTELLCGRTPRHAMQTLGSEWGRNLIDPEIWVTAWKNTMPKGNVVIDDMRFPNESRMVKGVGGVTVAVRRPGHDYSREHDSELFELPWDYLIKNQSTIEDLHERVEFIFTQLKG